jgi:hypothetical protein
MQPAVPIGSHFYLFPSLSRSISPTNPTFNSAA